MATTVNKHERNLSALIHASTFSKYFIPFGNFILPLILWTANKKEYSFVDHNGKEALNFQISLLLYSILVSIISIPFFIGFFPDLFNWNGWGWNRLNDLNTTNINFDLDGFSLRRLLWPAGISGLLYGALAIVNVVYTILATMRTNEGQEFKYPITIKFIK